MNEDEKQSLAFARVLLQRPHWLVIDGTLDKPNPAARERIETYLAAERGTGVVNIGADNARPGLFTRKVRLVFDPNGPAFSPSDD